jgi:hypothetical protein
VPPALTDGAEYIKRAKDLTGLYKPPSLTSAPSGKPRSGVLLHVSACQKSFYNNTLSGPREVQARRRTRGAACTDGAGYIKRAKD